MPHSAKAQKSRLSISQKSDGMHPQNKSRIDIGRLRRLSSAFGAYTVSGLTGANAGPPAAAAPAAAPAATLAARGGASASLAPVATLDDTTRDALKLVFSTQGSYAQASTSSITHSASQGFVSQGQDFWGL